jgi:hypothetical protein
MGTCAFLAFDKTQKLNITNVSTAISNSMRPLLMEQMFIFRTASCTSSPHYKMKASSQRIMLSISRLVAHVHQMP